MLQLIQDNFLVFLVLGIVMYKFRVLLLTMLKDYLVAFFTLLALVGVLYSFEVGFGVAYEQAVTLLSDVVSKFGSSSEPD